MTGSQTERAVAASNMSRGAGLLRSILRSMMHTYFLMTRGLTLGVRAIVRSNDGKFLLVRHTYMPGWHFPGGGVERGEDAIRAIAKELSQETGLTLIGTPVLHGVFHNKAVSPRDHVLVYLCDTTGTLPSKSPSAEIAELGYFDIDSLPEGIDSGTLRRIRDIVDTTTPGAVW